MTHRLIHPSVLIVLLLASGCGRSSAADYPVVNGRRVQGVSLAPSAAVPYKVDAYELVFSPDPRESRDVRRAALLVDLAGGQGQARGFLEWGRSDEPPQVYVVGGWARQRDRAGDVQTVFELVLDHFAVRGADLSAPESVPVAVRVIVHEASGDVTLLRRR